MPKKTNKQNYYHNLLKKLKKIEEDSAQNLQEKLNKLFTEIQTDFNFYRELVVLQNKIAKGDSEIQNNLETAKKIEEVKKKIATLQS